MNFPGGEGDCKAPAGLWVMQRNARNFSNKWNARLMSWWVITKTFCSFSWRRKCKWEIAFSALLLFHCCRREPSLILPIIYLLRFSLNKKVKLERLLPKLRVKSDSFQAFSSLSRRWNANKINWTFLILCLLSRIATRHMPKKPKRMRREEESKSGCWKSILKLPFHLRLAPTQLVFLSNYTRICRSETTQKTTRNS